MEALIRSLKMALTDHPEKFIIGWLIVVSAVSVLACVYDKVISKQNAVELRVPEKTLMLLSLFGGSVAMFITMLLVRHKTKHVKFMLGIPLIIALHAAVVYLLFRYNIF